MAGKFRLYEDKSGRFRFQLKAGNGEILAVGEAFDKKADAEKMIDLVIKTAATAKVVEV